MAEQSETNVGDYINRTHERTSPDESGMDIHTQRQNRNTQKTNMSINPRTRMPNPVTLRIPPHTKRIQNTLHWKGTNK